MSVWTTFQWSAAFGREHPTTGDLLQDGAGVLRGTKHRRRHSMRWQQSQPPRVADSIFPKPHPLSD